MLKVSSVSVNNMDDALFRNCLSNVIVGLSKVNPPLISRRPNLKGNVPILWYTIFLTVSAYARGPQFRSYYVYVLTGA